MSTRSQFRTAHAAEIVALHDALNSTNGAECIAARDRLRALDAEWELCKPDMPSDLIRARVNSGSKVHLVHGRSTYCNVLHRSRQTRIHPAPDAPVTCSVCATHPAL